MKKTKTLFKQKWIEIATEERSPGLKGVFSKYANGIAQSTLAHEGSIQVLNTAVQDSLRNYPIKITNQKRSLSQRNKITRNKLQKSKSLNKLENKADPRSTNEKKLSAAAQEADNANRMAVQADAKMQSDLDDLETSRITDLKNMMFHMINAEMHYHASVLDECAKIVSSVNDINERQEMATLEGPPRTG